MAHTALCGNGAIFHQSGTSVDQMEGRSAHVYKETALDVPTQKLKHGRLMIMF